MDSVMNTMTCQEKTHMEKKMNLERIKPKDVRKLKHGIYIVILIEYRKISMLDYNTKKRKMKNTIVLTLMNDSTFYEHCIYLQNNVVEEYNLTKDSCISEFEYTDGKIILTL